MKMLRLHVLGENLVFAVAQIGIRSFGFHTCQNQYLNSSMGLEFPLQIRHREPHTSVFK
jgi:hypothetical protein